MASTPGSTISFAYVTLTRLPTTLTRQLVAREGRSTSIIPVFNDVMEKKIAKITAVLFLGVFS